MTWTQLYADVFGPTGTSGCSTNGGCHTNMKRGFRCGSDAATCYQGFVNAGLVSPGAQASSSDLVNSGSSPLCGLSPYGTMPETGSCVTAAQIQDIRSWLANGANND